MGNVNMQGLSVTNEDIIQLCWQSLAGQRDDWEANYVTFIWMVSVKRSTENTVN